MPELFGPTDERGRRGVITLVSAPGDGEVTVVPDETLGEKDPLLAQLLAAATTGAAPAGPASQRRPIRIVLGPDDRSVGTRTLCATTPGFNLQPAARVAANDKPGRERLCRYILRPPLANERLSILDDGNVRLDFKQTWSNGTSSVDLPPLARIAGLAALVPPPRRHLTRYCGVRSATEAPEKPAASRSTAPAHGSTRASPRAPPSAGRPGGAGRGRLAQRSGEAESAGLE